MWQYIFVLITCRTDNTDKRKQGDNKQHLCCPKIPRWRDYKGDEGSLFILTNEGRMTESGKHLTLV